MGQSLSQIYVHLTFGTKNRYPFIKEEVENELHSYIAGTLKKYDSPALLINSVPDHIHILFRLSKNYTIARIAEEIKKQSSKWMKLKTHGHKEFRWQNGYGAFSVSSSGLEFVKNYIANQKEHHKKRTFQDEVKEFMRQYEVEAYNESFFWD